MNMNTPTFVLINLLERQTQDCIRRAEALLQFPLAELMNRPTAESWNALECIEHLNRYGAFYLPEIRKRIATSTFQPTSMFKPGLLGNYFTKSMQPRQGMKKMKTFADKDPKHTNLDKQCLHTFIGQQQELLQLLTSAREVDLNRTKSSISITKLLTLKLGDTFRFLIAHQERHLVQAYAAIGATHPATVQAIAGV